MKNKSWKWQSGKETPINEMTIRQTLKASLHCMKKIRHYSDKTRFWEYKGDVSRTPKFKKTTEKKIAYFTKVKSLFEGLLEDLSVQLLELGKELPSDFEEIKTMLDDYPEDVETPEEFLIRRKAEKVNVEVEENNGHL